MTRGGAQLGRAGVVALLTVLQTPKGTRESLCEQARAVKADGVQHIPDFPRLFPTSVGKQLVASVTALGNSVAGQRAPCLVFILFYLFRDLVKFLIPHLFVHAYLKDVIAQMMPISKLTWVF